MSPNSIVKSPETDLQPIIDDVVKRRNLTKCDSSIQYGNVKGDGYIGIVTAVKLEGYNEKGEKEVFNLVFKTAPKSEKLREGAPIREAFLREVYFYDEIYPIFEDLQNELNVKNRFNSICECVATSITKNQEALALRNLKDLGYSLWDRKVPMNEDHVSLVMKEYGKLHAMSFALREKRKSAFDKIASEIDLNIFNEFMKQSNTVFEDACDNALKGFGNDIDGKYYDALLRFKGEIHQFLFEDVVNIDEYSAILHGDCWTNNMMFKYEDENFKNKPSSMCFLDFQMLRLASPVIDLSEFFYCCGSNKLLNNYQHYLELYHESLCDQLADMDCNGNKLFPFPILLNHWKLYSKYGLLLSLVIVKIMISDANEVPDLTAAAESGKNDATNKPSTMCLIDFQIIRLASPVLDIAYFFYCCSTKSIIENHMHYINLYYQSFCEFLAQFGCDGHQLFPFEKLLEHWKLYGKYGLVLALIALKIMLSDKEEVPDLTEAAESGKNIVDAFAFESSQEEIYLERLRAILEHFVDHNYV